MDFPFDDEELLEPVLTAIEKVRPYLKSEGGDIQILKIKNHCVFVRLMGACSGCAHSGVTLKTRVEAQLKKDIHPEISVMAVKNGDEYENF